MQLFLHRLFLHCIVLLNRILKKDSSPSNLKQYCWYNWEAIEKKKIKNSLIVFSSAIGEFNAIRPYIDLFLTQRTDNSLVILCYDSQYIETYHNIYPKAVIALMPSPNPHLFDELASLTNPEQVVIAEGPCLYCHFPLRLDLSFATMCITHGLPLFVLNATPWPITFPSRIFRIEYWLFGNLFKRAISNWFTPYETFKQQLVQNGIPAQKIHTVGDMKYDIASSQPLVPPSEELSALLQIFQETPGTPLIVAGSVSSPEEQIQIISAWQGMKQHYPKTKLVLAPRQINQPQAMDPLRAYLKKSKYNYAFRSSGENESQTADLLILDVYGELMHFYKVSSLCFIGQNHGVLEPLKFKKLTIVGPPQSWDHDKPTFLMYDQHIKASSIINVAEMDKLDQCFVEMYKNQEKQTTFRKKSEALIMQETGAAKRIKRYVDEFISHTNNPTTRN